MMSNLSELEKYLNIKNQNKIGLYIGSRLSSLCSWTAATVRSLSSSARLYSTKEALEMIVHCKCEDGTSSSSEESEADMEEASEVETDQLKFN